jgi:hypothetical protein
MTKTSADIPTNIHFATLTPAEQAYWDESHATTLRSTEEVNVSLDIVVTEDDELVVQRTVCRKAYRARDRHILWQGDVLALPRGATSGFIRDLVDSLTQ